MEVAGPAGAAAAVGGAAVPVGSPPERRRRRRTQSGVAAAVTRSHETIPPAFATAEVVVDRVLAELDRIGASTGVPIDLPAFALAAVASLHREHPGVFAAVAEDGTPAPTSTADLAVTVDAGEGLYLPVLRGAAALPLDEVADRLVELQMAALAGSLPAADLDLTGVGMGVSLTVVRGVTMVQPLIMPGLSCMVSFGGVRSVFRPDEDGAPVRARTMVVGLSHDHRVVNGRPAAEFLVALAGRFSRPEPVLAR